jgi:Na+-driven multidrug efflux pump
MIRHRLIVKLSNWRELFSFKDWKTYLRVGSWSGLDSLVRNVAYFFLIIRLLNLLGENYIGGYYLTMHIFWSFLLVPFLALSESSKVLVANHSENLEQVRRLWAGSMIIGLLLLLFWAVLLPFWRGFAGILNSNAAIVDISVQAMALLIVPYMLFALNNTTDAIFTGWVKLNILFSRASLPMPWSTVLLLLLI